MTDKPIGGYEFKPWSASAPAASGKLDYTVIELYLDGNGHGDGTLSLAAAVQVDAASSTITLADGAPRVLANAKVAPKTY